MKRIMSLTVAVVAAVGLAWGLAAPAVATPQTPFPAPIFGLTTIPPIGMVQLAGGSGEQPGTAVVSVTRVCNTFSYVMSVDGCALPNPIVAGFDVRWVNMSTGVSGMARMTPEFGGPTTASVQFETGPGVVVAMVTSAQMPVATPGVGSFAVR